MLGLTCYKMYISPRLVPKERAGNRTITESSLWLCCTCTNFSFLGFSAPRPVNKYCLLCVSVGFFALPLVPICMELGVEITYPLPRQPAQDSCGV